MVMQVFDKSYYALDLLAIPQLGVALIALILSIKVLFREGSKSVSLAFLMLCGAIFLWLSSYFLMYCATDEGVARWWAKASYLGVPFIPSALYYFTVAVLQLYKTKKKIVWIGWGLSSISAIVIIGTDLVITHMRMFTWGYYPQYSLWSIPFLFFFVVYLGLSLLLLREKYFLSPPDSAQCHRIKLFLIAIFIASIGIIDYLPNFGISIYPIGYLGIFAAVIIFDRTVDKYRLVDITPKFAAQSIVDTMNDALLVLDAEGIIRLVNHAAINLFGLHENRIIGKPINDLIGDVIFPNLKANIRQGKYQHYEHNYRHPERDMKVISLSVSEMADERGQLLAIVLIARDITEDKRAEELLRRAFDEMEMRVEERTADHAASNAALKAEILERKRTDEALRQSEERYRLLTETSPSSVTVADLTGNIVMLNKRALNIYGHSDVSEVLGRSIFEWVPLEEMEKVSVAFARVLDGEALDNFELLLKKGQGEFFRASVNTALVRNKEGNPELIIIVTTDITERKRTEEVREELLLKLREALAKVKTLSGMLPICSYCKKIRDDEGYWNQVDSYISKHTDAVLSHGLCPECAEKEIRKIEEFKKNSGL